MGLIDTTLKEIGGMGIRSAGKRAVSAAEKRAAEAAAAGGENASKGLLSRMTNIQRTARAMDEGSVASRIVNATKMTGGGLTNEVGTVVTERVAAKAEAKVATEFAEVAEKDVIKEVEAKAAAKVAGRSDEVARQATENVAREQARAETTMSHNLSQKEAEAIEERVAEKLADPKFATENADAIKAAMPAAEKDMVDAEVKAFKETDEFAEKVAEKVEAGRGSEAWEKAVAKESGELMKAEVGIPQVNSTASQSIGGKILKYGSIFPLANGGLSAIAGFQQGGLAGAAVNGASGVMNGYGAEGNLIGNVAGFVTGTPAQTAYAADGSAGGGNAGAVAQGTGTIEAIAADVSRGDWGAVLRDGMAMVGNNPMLALALGGGVLSLTGIGGQLGSSMGNIALMVGLAGTVVPLVAKGFFGSSATPENAQIAQDMMQQVQSVDVAQQADEGVSLESDATAAADSYQMG